MEPLLLNATQAAQAIGISRSKLYDLHSEGRLPDPVRLGRRRLWRLAELQAWTAAGCPPRHEWEEEDREST